MGDGFHTFSMEWRMDSILFQDGFHGIGDGFHAFLRWNGWTPYCFHFVRARPSSLVHMTLARCGGGGLLAGGGGGCSSWPGGGCSSWPGGGCSSWPFMVELRGGGVGWLVVINEDDQR